MIALLEAKRAGLFARNAWIPNIVAGIIVGVVALPLGMAFAIASGVKPEQGIYTAIIAGLAVSIFGGTRVQIAGPTGAFIVILAGVVADHGVSGLQTATLMAGVMLLVMGLARLGGVIRFIPAPVIIGFTAGIGVIIWVGQWKDFFGLPTVEGRQFHEKLLFLFKHLPQLDFMTTFLAMASLLIVIYAPRIPRMSRVPGPLVALIVLTAAQSIFHFPTVATIGSTFGEIPRGLPGFSMPDLSPDTMLSLIGPAFTIAMLGAIESLLSAVVADNMTGTRHNSNQELFGQGLANIVAPMFAGFAATGAIARTATNIRNGGNSPIAGIVHAIVLILVLLVFAPLAKNIPLATLAAILFIVSWNMSQPRVVIHTLRRAPKSDVFILLVTFFLTVFTDLVLAVNIGVIVAMLLFLKKMADSIKVRVQNEKTLKREFAHTSGLKLPKHAAVFVVEGPIFFAAVESFEQALSETARDREAVVVRMRYVPFIDGTALQALEKVLAELLEQGTIVVLTEVNTSVKSMLSRMGLVRKLGNDHFIAAVPDALDFVQQLLDKRAEKLAQEESESPAGLDTQAEAAVVDTDGADITADELPPAAQEPKKRDKVATDELKKAHSEGRAEPVGSNQVSKEKGSSDKDSEDSS